MNHIQRVAYFVFGVLLASSGIACNLSFLSSATTPTPSPIAAIVASTPTVTVPTVQPVPPTTASTAQPPAVQNNAPQNNAASFSGAPVILLLDSGKGTMGDIYKYDVATRSIKQLTTWGYNFPPVVSPNGQWLAYLSVSQSAVNAIQSGTAMNAQVYANIWLFNPYTEDAVRIADQPANASYASGNLIARMTTPVWSPDSSSVGWIEGNNQGLRLGIYTLASKSAATYPLNLPAICCEGASWGMFWGRSGIAIMGNEGTFDHTEQVVYVFSPRGERLVRTVLATDTYLEYGWTIDNNNREYLAGVTNGEFTVVDPFNNGGIAIRGYPELYSINAPNGMAVHQGNDPSVWTVTRQGQNLTDLTNLTDVRNLSIAPDGSGVLNIQGDYLRGGKLFAVLANGQTVQITPPARLITATWGAWVWRIQPQ